MKNLSLSGFLLGVCTASVAQTSTCAAGSYDPAGGSACVPAPAGRFVPNAGAIVAIPAGFGTYVPAAGATAALLAPPGTFVAVTGAVAPTPAPPGYYVAISGATSANAAAPGTYVPAAGATAALLAPPGTFVPTSGATAATPAPPGYYVAVAGATAASVAPPGTYVPVAGATAATLAPPGYYVAGAGATAAEAVKSGFYTAGAGATAPIGAGLLAQGANHAAIGTRQLLAARPEPAEQPGLTAALLGGRQSTAQDGITGSERLKGRHSGLLMQAQWQPAAAGGASAFAGWVEQRLDPLEAGTARSNQWLLGWSQRLGPVRATAFAGQARARSTRLVQELATPEEQSASTSTQVLGLQAAAAVPWPLWEATLRVEGGLTRLAQKGFTETGVAGTTAGLAVQSWTQVAAPVAVALRHGFGAAYVEAGVRADLNGQKALRASLTNGQVLAFDIPVAESSSRAFTARLGITGVEVAGGLRLHGVLALETGTPTREVQARLNLEKRW